MKTIITVLFIAFTVFACTKKIKSNAILIKDCTGSYINQDGVDYKICNTNKVVDFENGTEITVIYKKVKNCDGFDENGCLIYPIYEESVEGTIEITKIKTK